MTPEGSSQNVDYDDEHHNETNGRSVPCGESGMSGKSLESTRKMCITEARVPPTESKVVSFGSKVIEDKEAGSDQLQSYWEGKEQDQKDPVVRGGQHMKPF